MNQLLEKIYRKESKIGIIGLGYVGLPLAIEFLNEGFHVIGFDKDISKVDKIKAGSSYIKHINSMKIKEFVDAGIFNATSNEESISDMDVILICVPTPVNEFRVPDLTAVLSTAEIISKNMKSNVLVSLESSTYPTTTSHQIKPILDQSGKEHFLCYSPEREDPGNKNFTLKQIPKVLGADDAEARKIGKALYESIINNVHDVSSTSCAEAVKLTENIFRAVNISLSNELKIVFDEMGIDVWEVIDAAKTKPFGFMPFYPGPGVGGHCIPIDPFYLTYKAKEHGMSTRFIELAGEFNNIVLDHTIHKIKDILDREKGLACSEANILLLGMSYKKDIDDMRESPSVFIFEKLKKMAKSVAYNDDYIGEIPPMREHPDLMGLKSVKISPENLQKYDVTVLLTDHSYYDHDMILNSSALVLDSRNYFKEYSSKNLFKI
jgi:UDP-N-acetyl-D-glucosamine dehydrogenase